MIGCIKKDDYVVCFCDSYLLQTEKNDVNDKNLMCWCPDGLNHTLIIKDRSFIYNTFIRSIDDLFSINDERDIDKEFLVKKVVPCLNYEARRQSIIKKEYIEEMKYDFIMATYDHIYSVEKDCSVVEFQNNAFFDGNNFLAGAFDEIDEEDINKKILIALYLYELNMYAITFPILIRDTKTLECHYYGMDDLIKAYQEYISKGDN